MESSLNYNRLECENWDVFGGRDLQHVFELAEIFARRAVGKIVEEIG